MSQENFEALVALTVASAGLSGVKIQGSLIPGNLHPGPWSLGPLAAADGTIRAQIPDAHLMFDADVTVPIKQGEVDFSDATVEHVGPDSRLGVSEQGLYLDAPNGRSYLYQFSPSAPVAGVQYERRDALLGPWVSDRGKLLLQAFVEALLLQPPGGQAAGFTAQTRELLDRTALSGELRLGDGKFAGAGLQADLAGSADGHNVVRLQSDAIGRRLVADIASMALRNVVLTSAGMRLACAELTGALTLRAVAEGAQWRIELELEKMTVSGLQLDLLGTMQP